jgi:polysaccharide export outer membrane protein
MNLKFQCREVATYTVDSERITLIEALSKAKDLTIYGKRDNILIIREID